MKYFERKISVEDKMNLAVSFIIEGRFDIEKLRDSLELNKRAFELHHLINRNYLNDSVL